MENVKLTTTEKRYINQILREKDRTEPAGTVKKKVISRLLDKFPENINYRYRAKASAIILFFLSTVAMAQDLKPRVFFNTGIHEQSEQRFGTQLAVKAGAMIKTESRVGLRLEYTAALDLPIGKYEQMDLRAYYLFFEDRTFRAYFTAGGAWETTNGGKYLGFGLTGTVKLTETTRFMLDWQPTINGRFGGAGWTNHVGVGLSFDIFDKVPHNPRRGR